MFEKLEANWRQREKELLIGILEAMKDGVFIVNQQHDIEYLNPPLVAQFGPLEGQKCFEYLEGRQEVCPWCLNEGVFAGETVHQERYCEKVGKFYDSVSTPLRNADGSISKLCVFRDITERKHLEEALAGEKNFLQTIMENTSAMLAYLDCDFNFVRVNSAYARGAGHTKEELLGKNHFDIFPNAENQAIFERARDSGEPAEFQDKPFVFKDQPWRGVTYWDWTLTPVKDASGRVRGLLLSLIDTTERKRVERQLRFQADILARVNDAVVAIDNEHRVTYWNKAAERQYDLKAEDVMGRKLEEIYQYLWLRPEDEQAAKDSLAASGFWHGEKIHIKKSGEQIYVESSLHILKDESGAPAGVMAVIRDITESKQAEETVREAQRRFQRLIDSDIMGIIIADIEGKVLEANDAFLKMVGYDRDDLISGRIDWVNMTPPEYQHLDEKALEELFFAGLCPPFEKEYIRKDGSRVPILIGAVVWDTAADIPSWICFILDMTELRKTEQALRQSEANYRTLVESAPDGVLSVDAESRILDCNEALCDLWGYSKEEIKGKYISDFLPDLTLEEMEFYRAQITDKRQFEGEFKGLARDGRLVPLWGKASGLFDNQGNLTRAVIYVRDITERKKLEELKDEFIGLVSHELRTPLTVIIGSLNTVLSEFRRLPSNEIQQLLKDAALEAESLSHLLDNLLELSRAQAKQLLLHTETVRVDVAARSMVERIKRESPSHQFVFDFPEDMPAISADPLRLDRILYNLLENAVRYSPRGSEVRVFVRVEDKRLVVGIADQGAGISARDQSKIFEPFPRLEYDGVHGAGLGLLVCRRLVEAHGGEIWLESKRGQGATFYFSLPIKAREIV